MPKELHVRMPRELDVRMPIDRHTRELDVSMAIHLQLHDLGVAGHLSLLTCHAVKLKSIRIKSI